MSKFIRIYSTICVILYRLLIPITTVVLVLRALGVRIYTVLSGSMEPAIPTGSLAFSKIRNPQPKVGDVITYRRGEEIIVHRVKEMHGSEYITQGDANQYPDDPVSESQLDGVVLGHIPVVGFPSRFVLRLSKHIQTLVRVTGTALFLLGIALYKDPKEERKR